MKPAFRAALFLTGFLALAAGLGAAASKITSSLIQFTAYPGSLTISAGQEVGGHWGYAQTAAPQNWDLLYTQFGSSHVVFNYDGNKFDMQQTVAASDVVQEISAAGAGLGSYIESAKKVGNLTFRQRFTIVNNPRTGVLADTIQYKLTIENHGPVAHSVGCRLMLDDELINPSIDGAFLSVDNGITALQVNTLFEAASAQVPADWWCYDKDPSVSPPTLISRGATMNNPYGDPATPPDAMEFVHWDEVQGLGFWDIHPSMGQPFWSYPHLDTCVVLWWTGTGQAGDSSVVPSLSLPAGQSMDFITYYGLNQGPMLKTPTPYESFTPTPTISPSFTVSPTFSVSPTISPSFTVSPTFSISPTFSVSPTISPTFTVSPTFSVSPTDTSTQTNSPSPTVSPTLTITPTLTPCPTRTLSFTLSPTPSISPTWTPTADLTATPDFSPTPSPAGTPAHLKLIPRPANPDPAGGSGVWLPYIVTRDATVRIRVYDVSGETVRELNPFAAKTGANEEFWDLKNSSGLYCASGVFIYRIQAAAPGEVSEAWMKCSIVR